MCNANKLPLFGGLFTTPSLPVLPHHYRTRSTYTAHSVVAHSKHRYAGTRQTPFPQRVNDHPGSAGLTNPSNIIKYAQPGARDANFQGAQVWMSDLYTLYGLLLITLPLAC